MLAQSGAAPQIPFDSVPNFLKLPPNLYLGEAAGVLDHGGHAEPVRDDLDRSVDDDCFIGSKVVDRHARL